MRRRESLKALATLAAAYALPNNIGAKTNIDDNQHPVFAWINQKSGPRPAIGWYSGEELAYHETRVKPAWQLAPEFFPFMDHPAITNRQFRWLHKNELIYCHTTGSELRLTGTNAASDWISEPGNQVIANEGVTRFSPHSGNRLREAMVVPAFQFHLAQHPVWQAKISGMGAEFQVVICIKGRAGTPLYHSQWFRGTQELTIRIADLIKQKGYSLNYAQVHIALVVWKQSLDDKPEVSISLKAKTLPAVIVPLPVIKSEAEKLAHIQFIYCDANGKIVKWSSNQKALLNGKPITLQNGLIMLNELKQGNHKITIGVSSLIVRITDDIHWKCSANGSWQLNDKPKPVLTGTYFSIVHVSNPGLPTEKLVQTEEDYLKLPELERHYHFWESLTEEELAQRFRYLSQQGMEVVHISQGWGFWQKLDNGGKVSPFAAELFAQYYRLAADNDMAVVQALSHYPYYRKTNDSGWGTPPNEAYFQAGLSDQDWITVKETPFQQLFTSYLRDYGTLFRHETALLLLSTSGEGDHITGSARCNWVESMMKEFCPKTEFYAEPIHLFYKSLKAHTIGWKQSIIGSRTYTMGANIRSDLDLNLYFRLNRMDSRIIMAEGAFPAPGLYSRFNFESNNDRSTSWIATDYYRKHVRDNLYLGLIHGMQIMLTWEEHFTENERYCLNEFKKLLPNGFQPELPKVEVLYNEAIYNMRPITLGPIAEFAIRSACCDYSLVEEYTSKNNLKIDPSKPFDENIKKTWLGLSPFTAEGNYGFTWAKSIDGKHIAIYAYNIGGTYQHEVLYSRYHRIAKHTSASLRLGRLYTWQLWNLTTKKLETLNTDVLKLTNTADDFLVLLNV